MIVACSLPSFTLQPPLLVKAFSRTVLVQLFCTHNVGAECATLKSFTVTCKVECRKSGVRGAGLRLNIPGFIYGRHVSLGDIHTSTRERERLAFRRETRTRRVIDKQVLYSRVQEAG